MQKKGASDSHHIVLLAIVGVVALIGLVLAFGGGSGGSATGAVVADSDIIVSGGPIKVIQDQIGLIYGLIERRPPPRPNAVTVLAAEGAYNYNVHTGDSIWPASNVDVQQQYYIQYQDSTVTLKDSNPADGVTVTYSFNANGPFSPTLVLLNTPPTEAHAVHIHEAFANGNTIDSAMFYVWDLDSNTIWWYTDGFWKAQNDPKPEGVSFPGTLE